MYVHVRIHTYVRTYVHTYLHMYVCRQFNKKRVEQTVILHHQHRDIPECVHKHRVCLHWRMSHCPQQGRVNIREHSIHTTSKGIAPGEYTVLLATLVGAGKHIPTPDTFHDWRDTQFHKIVDDSGASTRTI